MTGLSRRQLERASYRRAEPAISADIVGVLLTMIYAARGEAKLPNRAALTERLVNRQDVPERLKNALQFVERYEGPSLLTYTDMVDFAQQAGILQRFNPAHVNAASNLNPLDAQHLLKMVKSDFEKEIAWLESVVGAADPTPNAVTTR